MKLSIIYHSKSGNTKAIAQIMADGAQSVEGTEVRCMSIDEVDKEFLTESDAAIFGTPTYAGNYSWQMKKWLDTESGKLAGKLGAAFATENYLGGGADFAELTILGHLLVKGMVVYSAGASKGQPFTHFGAVAIKDGTDDQKDRARIFGQRIAEKAHELFDS